MPYTDQRAMFSKLQILTDRIENATVKISGGAVHQKAAKSSTDLRTVVARLEAVAAKLEGGSANSAAGSSAIVEGFNEVLHGNLAKFFKLSEQIRGDVKSQVDIVKKAFGAQRDFLATVTKRTRASESELTALLKPTSGHMDAVQVFRDKNRGSKFFNHLSGVSEGIGCLGWVVAMNKPPVFVKEKADSAQFYLNRVLKDFKERDPKHVEWVKLFVASLKDLQEYTAQYHAVALTWAK